MQTLNTTGVGFILHDVVLCLWYPQYYLCIQKLYHTCIHRSSSSIFYGTWSMIVTIEKKHLYFYSFLTFNAMLYVYHIVVLFLYVLYSLEQPRRTVYSTLIYRCSSNGAVLKVAWHLRRLRTSSIGSSIAESRPSKGTNFLFFLNFSTRSFLYARDESPIVCLISRRSLTL